MQWHFCREGRFSRGGTNIVRKFQDQKYFTTYLPQYADSFYLMTARPISPECRRTPIHVAVALCIVMVAVLLVAGCSDCPQPLVSVTITKLDSNGNPVWAHEIDDGLSNGISDLVPTPDGGLVMAGSIAKTHSGCTLNKQRRLIRYSGTGMKLWERVFEPDALPIMKLISTNDGEFVIISGNEYDKKAEIQRLDQFGNTLWKRDIDKGSFFWSIIETSDDRLVAAESSYLIKLDNRGTILWQRSLENESLYGSLFLHEMKDTNGILLFSRSEASPHGIYRFEFNTNGNLVNSSRVVAADQLTIDSTSAVEDGYNILYSDANGGVRMIHINQTGTTIDQMKINGSRYITQTSDNGYFYAEKTEKWNNASRLDQYGVVKWSTTIPVDNKYSVYRVIQTTDGGFAILSVKSVQKDIGSLP
jgi:hypothetical protein